MGNDARKIFVDIDTLDPQAFVAHLTPDVRFRFGNGDAIHGREAVAAAVGGFFGTIGGMRHHVQQVWDLEDEVTIAHIDVEYTRQDGQSVTVPNIDILRWDGDLVADWQIVIDLAPVYA